MRLSRGQNPINLEKLDLSFTFLIVQRFTIPDSFPGGWGGGHRRISRHLPGGAVTNVALMTGICLSVFALISIMKILFSHENLPIFALISSQPEC